MSNITSRIHTENGKHRSCLASCEPGLDAKGKCRMKTFRLSFISIVVLFTFFSVHSMSGQTIQEPLHVDLSKTLGFIMGQHFSLNRIKDEYPYIGFFCHSGTIQVSI